VSNKFAYKNQFAIEIDAHIKFIEQNRSKKKLYKVAHIKKYYKKYLIYIKNTKTLQIKHNNF